MWDISIKILEFLFKLLPKIRSSVAVEVNSFRYSSIEDSPVIIITPYPSRYWADLQLTNRTNSIVFIKDISVTINNTRHYKQAQCKDKIRLEPHECADYSIIFPVSLYESPERR
jgi:hypothetical protein